MIIPRVPAAALYRVGRSLVEGRYLASPLARLLMGTAVVIARLNNPWLRRTLAALVVANLAVLTAVEWDGDAVLGASRH